MEESKGDQQKPTSQADRPTPTILISATNLLLSEKNLSGFVKGNFEFCNTRNRTGVVTKEMADFSAIKSFFQSKKLSFFTFHPNLKGCHKTPSLQHSG
jgi:hypothetical protein